jgi:hypothetical protein
MEKKKIEFRVSAQKHAEGVEIAAEKFEGGISEFARHAFLRVLAQYQSRPAKKRGKGLSQPSSGQPGAAL